MLTRISPDGQTVANLVDAGPGPESFAVQFLDLEAGARHPPSPFRESNAYYGDLQWRPDGKMVASTQNDQWVDLWDGASGQAAGRHRVPDRYGAVYGVAFSGDSTRLAVGTRRGWVYAVDSRTLQVVGKPVQVTDGVPVLALAMNGDGTRALVWVDRKLQLLDLEAGRVERVTNPGFDVTSWAWSPDGKAVVVVGSNRSQNGHGTVAFLDPETLAIRDMFAGPNVAGGEWIQFSPDGRRFATSGSDRVGLWDIDTSEYLGSVRAESGSHAGFRRLLRCARRVAGRQGLGLGPEARGCRRGGMPDRRASPDREGVARLPSRTGTRAGLRFVNTKGNAEHTWAVWRSEPAGASGVRQTHRVPLDGAARDPLFRSRADRTTASSWRM